MENNSYQTQDNQNTNTYPTEVLNIPALNKIFISGRICTVPESRDTANGKCVTFRLAHNANKKNNNGVFINVTCWERLAETVFRSMKKGSPVIIMGRICLNNWTDNDGKNRNDLFITADNVSFLRKNDIFDDVH